MNGNAPLDTPAIQSLHKETPLRVWSLIVTIFGDIVMQQGHLEKPDPVWNGVIVEILSLIGIEPGLVRTSLSRLVSNGTLVRLKSGRNTYYQLGEVNRLAFLSAAELIYGRKHADAAARLIMVSIDRCADRNECRQALTQQGFRFLGPTTALAVKNPDDTSLQIPAGSLVSTPRETPDLFATVHEIWKLDALNKGYEAFLETFPVMSKTTRLSTEEAIAERVLLVHQFRRLILRDPLLPATALPKGWKGDAARQRFAQNWHFLQETSELWIASKR